MVGTRNWRVLKIALAISAAFLVVYMLYSWRNESLVQADALATAKQEYQELLKNFNKLTSELKISVQRTADWRTDREKQEKVHLLTVSQKDDQLKKCHEKTKEILVAKENVEQDRDSYHDEINSLKLDKESAAADLSSVSDELVQMKLVFTTKEEEVKKCQSELESVKSQAMVAQTGSLESNQRLQECSAQLITAEEAFTACDARSRNQQSQNDQLLTQVQLLQNQVTDLKSKQLQVGLTDNKGVGVNQRAQPGEHSISDKRKLGVYSDLKSKMERGIQLTKQEEYAYQLLSKNVGGLDTNKFAKQHPSPIDTSNAQDGNEVQVRQKQPYGNQPPPDSDVLNKQVAPSREKQQAVPPQTNHDINKVKVIEEKEKVLEQEEVKDLINEDHVPENDDRENDYEGGADGDQNQDDAPGDDDNPVDGEERVGDVNESEENDKPLPYPVNGDGGHDEKFDDDLNGDALKQFELDRKKFDEDLKRNKRDRVAYQQEQALPGRYKRAEV